MAPGASSKDLRAVDDAFWVAGAKAMAAGRKSAATESFMVSGEKIRFGCRLRCFFWSGSGRIVRGSLFYFSGGSFVFRISAAGSPEQVPAKRYRQCAAYYRTNSTTAHRILERCTDRSTNREVCNH